MKNEDKKIVEKSRAMGMKRGGGWGSRRSVPPSVYDRKFLDVTIKFSGDPKVAANRRRCPAHF